MMRQRAPFLEGLLTMDTGEWSIVAPSMTAKIVQLGKLSWTEFTLEVLRFSTFMLGQSLCAIKLLTASLTEDLFGVLDSELIGISKFDVCSFFGTN